MNLQKYYAGLTLEMFVGSTIKSIIFRICILIAPLFGAILILTCLNVTRAFEQTEASDVSHVVINGKPLQQRRRC